MAKTTLEKISLGDLNTSPADAVRGGTRPAEVVAEYAAAYESGLSLPPLDVYGHAGNGTNAYFLADGGYRLAALRSLDYPVAECEVKWYDSPDVAETAAWRRAMIANTQHGVRRTNADKRAAVLAAIDRPEFTGCSSREIDALCGVGNGYTASVKRAQACPVGDGGQGGGVEDSSTVRGPVLDGLGRPVPECIADTFGDPTLPTTLDRIAKVLAELRSIVAHVQNTLSRKAEWLPYCHFGESLASFAAGVELVLTAHDQLDAGTPFVPCPTCGGHGYKPHAEAQPCKDCRGSGYWPRWRYAGRNQYGQQ